MPYVFCRHIELRKAIDVFHKSEFGNIVIDRYLRILDGTYLLFKKQVIDDLSDKYRHYIVTKDKEVIPVCPMKLNRFNPLLIKKIPERLLNKK